jgi:creatinine amidohydrolase
MPVMTVFNTTKELKNSKVDMAILPIGSIEQHGPHLPIGTDWIFAEEDAKRIAEKIGNCYLLPALPYGNAQEHLGFSGTVTLRPSTLAQVIRDIILSLYLQGIKKIVIVSDHGGNWIIKPTIRELNLEYPDLKIIHSTPMGNRPTDVHAGDSETSRMLYLNEKLVKKDEIIDSVPNVTQEFIDYVGLKVLSKHGHWGRPSQASSEKGKEEMDNIIKSTVSYIKRTFKKLDEFEKASNKRRSIKPPSRHLGK